ncbi:outer membrane beta-barrel protein [Labilibaculum sp.]|uniref:outer membrane beta-barrel protein n=1 Tax=Labilibaculum sp. TaxID=2060723 RepID=UPI002AA7898C|nr:outer membrane beta-barrel protein [Labilibaculum sp.]
MNKLILTFLLLSCFSSFGQTKYKNKVINLNNDDVFGAVATVTDINQHIFYQTVTDGSGCFEIEIPTNIAMDSLQLLISHLAYKTKKCKLSSVLRDSIITLEIDSKQVDDILIVGKKPLYTLENGKTVVNVSEVKFQPSDKSTDILSKLPFVDINSEESIKYENKTAIVIIDGVEQRIEGKALIATLKSIPADQIDKVVLSGNSLGKYNSSKSVIEIYTKSSFENGYYANIDLTGERYSDNKYGASNMFSMFGRYNKIQANFSLQYRPNSRVHSENLDSTIYNPTTIISRNTEWEKAQDVYQGNLSLAYSFDNGDVLNFTANTYNNSGKSNQDMNVGEYGSKFSFYRQKSNYELRDHLYTGLLQFSSNDTLPFHYTIVFDLVAGGENKEGKAEKEEFGGDFLSYFQSKNTMDGTQYTGRFDMTYEVNRVFEINSGIKYINGNINETSYSDTNVIPSTKFKGKEVNAEFYANGQARLSSKLFLGAGIRAELLDYHFNITSGEEILTNSYWTWFPSLKMTYKARGFSSILSIEKSVERPDYYDMLPGISYIDDYSYSVGNTQLKPTTYWSVNSKNTILGFISLWLGYENYKNAIEDVVYQEKGSSVFSVKNLSDLTMWYGRIDVPFTFAKNKLGGYLTAVTVFQNYTNPKNGLFVWDENRNEIHYKWFKGELWWDISERFNVSSQIHYRPKKKTLQYDISQDRIRLNLAAKFALLKNKQLNLTFSAVNVTNSYEENKVYYYNNLKQYEMSNNLALPKYSLGINWKFNRGNNVKKKNYSGEKVNVSRFSK